jgi:hypothetical protein
MPTAMTRSTRLLLRALVAVTLVLAVKPLAAEARPTGLSWPPVLPVTVTNDGFSVPGPNPRPAGLATFQVRTPDKTGHWLSLFRLNRGVTLEQAMREFYDSASSDPAVALPALRALYRDVDFQGGTAVFSTSPVGFTRLLTAGTYYLVETPPVPVPGRPPFYLQTLEVAGPVRATLPPRIDAAVSMAQLRGRPTFLTRSTLPAQGGILVSNLTFEPAELIILHVSPDTTDADVQAYFDALRNGEDPASSPLGAAGAGLLAISPGRSAVLHVDLPGGRYVLVSFLRNPDTGLPRAWEGFHKVVSLREDGTR